MFPYASTMMVFADAAAIKASLKVTGKLHYNLNNLTRLRKLPHRALGSQNQSNYMYSYLSLATTSSSRKVKNGKNTEK